MVIWFKLRLNGRVHVPIGVVFVNDYMCQITGSCTDLPAQVTVGVLASACVHKATPPCLSLRLEQIVPASPAPRIP